MQHTQVHTQIAPLLTFMSAGMTAGLEDFGATLRMRRRAAGLTQEELAERTGLSARGIQDLERGARRAPQKETVRRLVAALGQAEHRAPGLPHAISSFVGRECDVVEVERLVSRCRLVTLTGAGGIGKTRLALEVAATIRADAGCDVWLAELAPLASADLVVPCVAAALGIREQAFEPLVETVCNALAQRPCGLLVVDNCEHVLLACVGLVDTLLRACPTLRVLTTSRQSLGITGETIWRVPPLTVPGATALFLERARAIAPRLVLDERAVRGIAVICQRLDGVPLAIELAAARANLFSMEQIAAHLDHALRLLANGSRTAPHRHQTLQATFEWSYALLSPAERRLLEQLSIFAGGWTFDAAEAVAVDLPRESDDVLELLSLLVDKSLVMAEPTQDGTLRYRLHEVLRQFSQEHLSDAEQAESVRARHAGYFLRLVEHAEHAALAAERTAWLDRLELELDNFRAARRWFVARGEADAAQRLCACLYRSLMYRGHANEGRACLLEALAVEGGSPPVRAKALHCLASLAFTQADYVASADYGRQSLVLRQTGIADQTGIAWSYLVLASTATMSADFGAADELLSHARQASRSSGETYAWAMSLSLSALAAHMQGDSTTAHTRAEQAMHLAGSHGFTSITCMALSTLGSLSHQAGDRQAAVESLHLALETAEALGEDYLVVRASLGLAQVTADAGQTERAWSLLTETVTLARRLGNPHYVAQALEGMAAFDAAEGHAESALGLVDAASAIRCRIGAPRSPTEQRHLAAWGLK